MKVVSIRLGGEPAQWRELGFDVDDEGTVAIGTVRLDLDPSARPGAIDAWVLEGTDIPASIDGLRTEIGRRDGRNGAHPNGAVSIDHLVVLTPSLERTTAAFAELGIECRRVRDAGGGVRQAFFLVGDLLAEVVEGPGAGPEKPARFWGITVVVENIDRAAALLGDRIGDVKDAIQPGRRIATVRRESSGGLPLALITPRS